MRIWLQKQKKKEDAKAAQVATPPVEATPEIQSAGDAADKPVESVEETPKPEQAQADEVFAGVDNAEEVDQRAGSADAQPNEVGSPIVVSAACSGVWGSQEISEERNGSFARLVGMNTMIVAHAGSYRMHHVLRFTLRCC